MLLLEKLLREIHIPESQIKLSTDVLSAFVRKFSKRRCVTYLAKDGLSPLHEEDESAIRQMLKKFKKTDEQKKAETNAGATDICFRCHKQGHWASDCLEGHEEEWLTKQKCFQCGQQGHLKSQDYNYAKQTSHCEEDMVPCWQITAKAIKYFITKKSGSFPILQTNFQYSQ